MFILFWKDKCYGKQSFVTTWFQVKSVWDHKCCPCGGPTNCMLSKIRRLDMNYVNSLEILQFIVAFVGILMRLQKLSRSLIVSLNGVYVQINNNILKYLSNNLLLTTSVRHQIESTIPRLVATLAITLSCIVWYCGSIMWYVSHLHHI